MGAQEQHHSPTAAPSGGVVPLFPTWMHACEYEPTHTQEGLEQLAHSRTQDQGTASQRSKCAAWHYALDLFDRDESPVAEFRDDIQHLWSQVSRPLLDLATLPAPSEQPLKQPHA